MRHRNALAALTAAAALTLVLAGCGSDATDAKFLDLVATEGITVSSDQDALTAAHRICAQLDGGQPLMGVLMETAAVNPSWTPDQAGYFAGASIGAFCPEHAPASAS